MDSTAFVGGSVWSPADWPTPRVGRLLVTDGRIAAVGDVPDFPPRSEIVEMHGGTLIPAFGDGHAHPMQGGLEPLCAPVRGDSIVSIVEGVRQWAAEHPATEWVYGGGFDLSLTPDGVFDAQWLDAAVAERPVVLRGTDYHTLWCNSEALRRAGISAQTPDPDDGEIVRRPDGSPIGTLREWGATDPVFAVMSKPALSTRIQAIRDATGLCAAAGISWVQDAWVEPDEVTAYLAAAADGALTVRVNLALRADPTTWQSQVAEFIRLRFAVRAAGHRRLTANTVKFFVDGVIESGTASMLEPYLDHGHGHDQRHSHGLPNWSRPALTDAVRAFSEAGFQVHLHAIGDAAVRDSLDALEASAEVIEMGDLRPVIAHLQVVDPADLDRLRSLGVIACFQPLWAQPDPLQEVLTIPRIGPHRAALQYPIQSMVAGGTQVSFGSDWPVTDLSPLAGIATAVTRQTPEGEPAGGWYPWQRTDVRSSFAAYTRGVAVQGFRDDCGRLAIGDVADLTLIGLDLGASGPAEIRSAPVRGTWIGGERVY